MKYRTPVPTRTPKVRLHQPGNPKVRLHRLHAQSAQAGVSMLGARGGRAGVAPAALLALYMRFTYVDSPLFEPLASTILHSSASSSVPPAKRPAMPP